LAFNIILYIGLFICFVSWVWYNLVTQPYQCRPSFYFDDNNVRDMVYKKYTIVYEVNIDTDTIEIMRIFNRNKPD